MIDKDFNFAVEHVGFNTENEEAALKAAEMLSAVFGFDYKNGNTSIFAADRKIEILKRMYKGKYGHIAVSTTDIDGAVKYLKEKGFEFDEQSAVVKEGKLIAIYLKDDIAGFAFHLLRK